MPNDNKKIGFLGENIAARYLESRGYRIIARNYRKPWGEIDIIAEKEGVTVFCEVKTNSKEFGSSFGPELRVNPKKASHIIRTASLYLNSQKQNNEKEWRVDILSIIVNKLDSKAKVLHFKNALADFR
ncbi:MAG: YraN family protein [Candidatus Yanofskybacteria bacterium]|nr:YraN family protein [Candidatus Yanofskybacteria bacterium]